MERASKVVISRIQNRAGLRNNLPQPLRPGEIGLTTDTRQVWIGNEDLPPYGIRTYDRGVNIDDVNTVLDTLAGAATFARDLTEDEFRNVLSFFGRTNNRLFPPFISGVADPALFFNNTEQVLWDGGDTIYFGMRPDEITFAVTVDPVNMPWDSDFGAALDYFLAGTDGFLSFNPGFPALSSSTPLRNQFVVDLNTGGLDWQGRPDSFQVLLMDREIRGAAASGNAAQLINLIDSNDATRAEYVTTLSNIEIGTIDEFEILVDIPPDTLFQDPFRFELPPNGGVTAPVGFAVNADESDVIILEYAISTPTEGVVGVARISVYAPDNVVLYDDRADTSDLDISLTASASANTVFLEYRNSTLETGLLSFVVRRWASSNV